MALTEEFDTARSSFVLNATQVALAQKETELPSPPMEEGSSTSNAGEPLFIPDDDDAGGTEEVENIITGEPTSEVVVPTDDTSAGIPIEQEENASPPPRPPVEKRPRSASLDPVSDDSSTRPLKKKAATITRSPSPAPPASTTASQQRLAGPGRTPARVEQILSTNTSGGTGRGVQMVLDTSGASWNLKPGHEGPPQRKRSHLADADVNVNVSGSSSGKNARVNMRARLAGFARNGAHVVRDDTPEEEEGVEDEVVEGSKKVVDEDDDDDDDDEREVGDKPSSSTDIVDETMAVDHPDSEDEAPKSKPKPKARAPNSKRADKADPVSIEELHDSSSAPGNTAAATASSSSSSSRNGVQTEVVRTVIGAAPPLAFDLDRTTNTWTAYIERSSASTSTPQPAPRSSELGHADLAADNDNATATLARVLSKADFGSMRVVGQFNRGFIVARLRKTDMANDDLFIVDQHAADEKYNFETLQATTRLESQRLFTCVTFFCLLFTIVCGDRDGTGHGFWN